MLTDTAHVSIARSHLSCTSRTLRMCHSESETSAAIFQLELFIEESSMNSERLGLEKRISPNRTLLELPIKIPDQKVGCNRIEIISDDRKVVF